MNKIEYAARGTSNVSYAVFWLWAVREAIKKNQKGWHHHWTHINYSGGLSGWEDYMNNIYFRPQGFEERLLQEEVHEYMLIALDVAFAEAERNSTNSLDVAEAYRIARMVSQKDPLIAAVSKIRLNQLCAGLKKYKTLLDGAQRGFGELIMTRPEHCLEW